MSNNLDAAAHAGFVADALTWSVATAARHGLDLRVVNVGGGLGVDYRGDATIDLAALRAGLAGLTVPAGVDLIFEPGRILAADAGWYAAEVIDLKHTHGRRFAVLRGGTHHFRLPAAWGYSHPFTVLPVDDWPYDWPAPAGRRRGRGRGRRAVHPPRRARPRPARATGCGSATCWSSAAPARTAGTSPTTTSCATRRRASKCSDCRFLSYPVDRLRGVEHDDFVLPDAWLQHLHPRRGGAGTLPYAADPQARARTDRMLAERQGEVTAVLAADSTPEVVRAAATQWLSGSAVPVGAAAVAAITEKGQADGAALADVWITEHGLGFAAVAAVETASLLIIDDRQPPGWRYAPMAAPGVRHRLPDDPGDDSPLGLPVLLRVRAALASAPQDRFEQVVAALAAYRSGSPQARAACSVLVPRPQWVEEDVSHALSTHDPAMSAMLLYAAQTPQQAALLAPVVDLVHLGVDSDLVITLVDGVGPAAAPALFHWFDKGFWAYAAPGAEQRMLSVLAALPGDDVMHGLLSRSDRRSVRAALLEAAGRSPARAMRILAEQDDDLLRVHVVKHLDLVDQVLPLLSPAAGARVRAAAEAWDEVRTAPPSAVPPVLADPPWHNRRKAARPPVVAGLTCTDAPAASWLPEERRQWAQTEWSFRDYPAPDWSALGPSPGVPDVFQAEHPLGLEESLGQRRTATGGELVQARVAATSTECVAGSTRSARSPRKVISPTLSRRW